MLLLFLAASQVGSAEPIAYSMRTLGGVSLHVLDIDLNDPHVVVSPALTAGGIGRSESFSKFIHRLSPAAAVNGTFFSKTSLRPIGDIVIDGKLVHFGGMGTALAFTPDGVDCIRLPKSRYVDWSEHRAALAAGPLLVWNGFAKPFPGGEGFGDPSVFARAAPRTAAGVTRDNHLLLVTTKRGTSLRLLAAAMRDIGALYAVNLDGGASTGMWHRGRMIRRPVSQLTNILCVYVKPDSVSSRQLRPPRGLDWRAGHRPRPTLSFTAGDLCVTVHLPRKWEGQQPVQVGADGPLPDGWTISIWLDENPFAMSSELPFEFALDLAALPGPGPKHSLWIGILDREGKAVGRAERIFRLAADG